MNVPNWGSMFSYYFMLPMHPDGDFYSCAIRLSMCLYQAGAFKKVGYEKSGNKVSKNGWAMVAEELYNWLRLHELGAAQLITITPGDLSQLPTQNGIIYLRNCFIRSTDRDPSSITGDHIDLYLNGKGLLSALMWPTEFPDGPFGLVSSCRDNNIRFWPAP